MASKSGSERYAVEHLDKKVEPSPIQDLKGSANRVWTVIEMANGLIQVFNTTGSGLIYSGRTYEEALEELRANAFGER